MTRSNECQESMYPCRVINGKPKGSPRSTYWSLTWFGSSTVITLNFISICSRHLGISNRLSTGHPLFWSEPAVRILCNQVEEALTGIIHKRGCSNSDLYRGSNYRCIRYGENCLSHSSIMYFDSRLHTCYSMVWLAPKYFIGFTFDAGSVARVGLQFWVRPYVF